MTEIKLTPPPIQIRQTPVEQVHVDTLLQEWEASTTPGATRLKLTVVVPDMDPHSPSPDNRAALARIMQTLSGHGHKLRLQLVSDAEVKSQFSRLQEDGSIRDLAPGEGEW